MAGKFEVYKDFMGEFRFRLKAGNGQVIATGEGYVTKAACMNGIESIKKNAKNSKVIDLDGDCINHSVKHVSFGHQIETPYDDTTQNRVIDKEIALNVVKDVFDEHFKGWEVRHGIKRHEATDIFDLVVRSLSSAWVSVDDRLPEHNQMVLAICTDNRYDPWRVCQYRECRGYKSPSINKGEFWLLAKCPLEIYYYVTHWMPLPEPPESEVKDE